MLQKILFESSKIKPQEKSSPNQTKILPKSKFNRFLITKKILYHKYSKFEYSFSLLCTNNLIFNEKCRIVARFKDFLVLDDSTEFLRRFYLKKELKTRLKKIYNFYDSYCKIFPNYMILPESQFLYRNIRKKQKMIDAFNEIKKEEEENRKHLKLGIVNENLKNKEQNVVFTKKIQESIERYHPSLSNLLSNTFTSEIGNNLNNEIQNNDKNSVTISLNSQMPLNFFEFDKFFLSNRNSFLENNLNDNTINSQNSILKIVQILNNNNINENNKNTFNEKNNNHNKINKIEYKNNISQFKSNKIIKKNDNINNNAKQNTKILVGNNEYNTINSNSNSNKNINLKLNKINNINNHSNNKKNKQENKSNANNKRKFISHKQTVSVPIASHMLNNNDNNILEEKNTIKIINNINNIIINDNKNKTINNGMIININNNYYQLKDPKKANSKMIKRIKSKEEQKKEKSKPKENKVIKDKIEKEDELDNFKIFREKRIYTTYNINKKNKKNINKNQSPNKKKGKDKDNKAHNIDNKKNNKNINSNNYFLEINNNNGSTNKQNNVYRNTINYQNENKTINKRYIESNIYHESQPTMNNNHNATEINNNYKNIFGNKIKISINKNKEKPKLEVIESLDNKKMSINRKIVNNYLTTTNKKKTYQGKFTGAESSSLNTYNNFNNNINNTKNNNKKHNDISEKIEVLNIYNTIQNKNNPIKFKLDKKNMIRKTKTNSVQINNKKEFLSSFNLQKEKLPGTNIEIDIINIENNLVKYNKNSKKIFLNNKTQSNSEAKLIKDINNKNNILNAFTNKSLKKDNLNNINDKKVNNIDNNLNAIDMKKINVKEMKEKYHKLLRGNKVNHGSYDTTSRLHILKKFKVLSNQTGSMTKSINKTIISNKKRSPINKKKILSPNERIQNNMSNYIKSPIKNKFNLSNKNTSIENYNIVGGKKFHLIGKKNKQIDTNNKKMKFIQK